MAINKKIDVDQRSDTAAYITIDDWVIYVDNSTGEKIITTWTKGENQKAKTYYADK